MNKLGCKRKITLHILAQVWTKCISLEREAIFWACLPTVFLSCCTVSCNIIIIASYLVSRLEVFTVMALGRLGTVVGVRRESDIRLSYLCLITAAAMQCS